MFEHYLASTWPLFLLLGLGAVLCAILSTVFLCVWTYHDAKSRGLDAGVWAVVVFFTSLLGLLIYCAAVRSKPVARCYSCGMANPLGSTFCGRCGQPLPPMQMPSKAVNGYLIAFIIFSILTVLLVIALVLTLIVVPAVNYGLGSYSYRIW